MELRFRPFSAWALTAAFVLASSILLQAPSDLAPESTRTALLPGPSEEPGAPTRAVPESLPAHPPPFSQVGAAGNEPLLLIGNDGTIYMSALQHLYRSTNGGASFEKIAAPIYGDSLNLNSDSGLAMDPGGRLYYTIDWPYVGSTAVCFSDNRGDSWTCNPVAVPGVTDRMWVAAPSDSLAYLVTNVGLYQTTFLVSVDRGLTWAPVGVRAAVLSPQTGNLVVPPGSTTQVFQPSKRFTDSNMVFYVWNPPVPGAPAAGFGQYRDTTMTAPQALPSAGFTSDGTLYAVSEVAGKPTLARSINQGTTWTKFTITSAFGTTTLSALAAGAPGHIGVVFYATSSTGNPRTLTNADWSVVFAESMDANTASPTWTLTTVDSWAHHGSICIGGGCEDQPGSSPNGRFAGDFISAAFDASGQAHVAWMADSGTTEVRYAQV